MQTHWEQRQGLLHTLY